MTAVVQFLTVSLILLGQGVSSARILGLFPHMAKSHFLMGEALMKGLASRGHEVVVVSHFPQERPLINYTDISLVGSMPNVVGNMDLDSTVGGAANNAFVSMNMLYNMGVDACENTLPFKPVQELIHSNQKFDLIVNELFNSDCYLGFVHKFQVPFISLETSAMMPWGYSRFGSPDDPSYIPNHMLGHSDRMTFMERLVNTIWKVGLNLVYEYVFLPASQRIANKHFGDSLPPLADIARNTSLLLINSHFSLNQPNPFVPAIIEVGGLHVKTPKPLPKDLKDFIDGAKDGVIYFSLGSIVRASSFPQDKVDAMLNAFSELPQRVLWKWETDSIPGQPDNVRVQKWMPQLDILSHPNVRVFMTHGGLMGTIEAVQAGVPMVAIPLFGDQFLNVKSYENEKIAVKLDYSTISKETVLTALKTVLYNPEYQENARRVSRAYKDRPLSPLDTAIYWTEYVMRHNGARHLRAASVDMPWYQYWMLDVLAVFVLLFVVSLTVSLLLVKKLISIFLNIAFKSEETVRSNKKSKKIKSK